MPQTTVTMLSMSLTACWCCGSLGACVLTIDHATRIAADGGTMPISERAAKIFFRRFMCLQGSTSRPRQPRHEVHRHRRPPPREHTGEGELAGGVAGREHAVVVHVVAHRDDQ